MSVPGPESMIEINDILGNFYIMQFKRNTNNKKVDRSDIWKESGA